VIRTRDASEGAILLLTRGRALAYATQHSPWTTVERACKPDATCSQGKGACGAMLDASGGGRVVTVFVALQEEGLAGIVQLCPGVHAVDGDTKGPGDSARRRKAGKARTRRSVAAKGRPQLCAAPPRRTRVCSALHERCAR
jgi:hypothetical protein